MAAQSWPAFQTTFGSFWQQPRTRGEAEAGGWIQLSPCSDKFLGNRYANPNDDSIILIYDDAGFIAGSQSVVPAELVDPDVMDMSVQPAYQLDAWFDIPAYITTMYFVDPDIICNGGRSQEQFDNQGTGDRLVIQVRHMKITKKSINSQFRLELKLQRIILLLCHCQRQKL